MRRLLPARWLSSLRTDAAAPSDPSDEVLRESRRRIRVAAAIGGASYALFLIVQLSGVLPTTPLQDSISLAHNCLGALICAAMLVLTLVRSIPDRSILTLALGSELLLAALISIADPWSSFLRSGQLPSLSWVVPMMILFPLLVPVRPRTVVWVSLASALMMPAGLGVLAATGRVSAGVSDYLDAILAGVVGAGIAVVASRTVHGVRRQLAVARTMGSYELIERLGQGGMGEVWRASHLLLARPAAVKLILPERLSVAAEARDLVVTRFTREAQVTAGLRSPHTVDLFDFGVNGDGVMYYAMELLDGINLEHFVYRYGPIPPRRAVNWLRQVCHSLGEAHARGLTHRDIKPANILVCSYGRERDFLKVLDFGLVLPPATVEGAGLTREGAWIGTPGYVAPEQVYGGEAGPRSDLYALGCVAYWLLAGVKPFDADDSSELMRQHLQDLPVPLGKRASQPIPEPLERAVMSCLAKNPADRPTDIDDFSERLARSETGEPWSEADAGSWWDAQLLQT